MRRRLLRHLFTALWAAGATVIYMWLGFRFDWPTWVLAFVVIVLGDAIRDATE